MSNVFGPPAEWIRLYIILFFAFLHLILERHSHSDPCVERIQSTSPMDLVVHNSFQCHSHTDPPCVERIQSAS